MSKGNRHRDNFSHGFIETEMYGEQEIKRIYVVNDDGKCIFKTKFSIPHRTDTIKVIVNLALEMLGDYDSTKVYPKKPVW